MEYKVKTLDIREIIHLASKKNLNKNRTTYIQFFLNDIPEKSNYDIQLYCFGYARVGILTEQFNKSTQTFKKHISLNELHNNCYLILNENQYNTLYEIYILVREEMLFIFDEQDKEKNNKLDSIYEEQHGDEEYFKEEHDNEYHGDEKYFKEHHGDEQYFKEQHNELWSIYEEEHVELPNIN
jgi:hypothetical protein